VDYPFYCSGIHDGLFCIFQGFTTKKYAHWQQKTTQYVLGLPEEEVMKSLDI
jgi:hypothetical protein